MVFRAGGGTKSVLTYWDGVVGIGVVPGRRGYESVEQELVCSTQGTIE